MLDQYLKPSTLSQNRLARALGVPPRRINEIILGKRAITADTALRLGRYFGNSAADWMQLQAEYDIAQAREKISGQLQRIPALRKGESELVAAKPLIDEQHPRTSKPKRNIKRRMMR